MKLTEIHANHAHTEWVSQGKPVYLGNHLDDAIESEIGMDAQEFADIIAHEAEPLSNEVFMKRIFERPKEIGFKHDPEYLWQYEDFYIAGDAATGLYHIWG